MVLLLGTLIFALSYKGKIGFAKDRNVEGLEEQNEIVQEDIGQPTNDNAWDELGRIVKSYYGNGRSFYTGVVKVIDDNGAAEKVLEEHPFVFRLFGKGFHYVIDSVDFIKQGAYVAVVDNRAKLISLSGLDDQQKSLPLFDMDLFRKMMEEQKANMLVTEQGNEKILTVDSIQHPQIQGYRIYYDPQSYKIHRMVIGMLRLSSLDDQEQADAEDAKAAGEKDDIAGSQNQEGAPDIYTYYVDITYKETEAASGSGDELPLSRFFKKTGDHFELNERYKNYQFINTEESESDSLMQTETDK